MTATLCFAALCLLPGVPLALLLRGRLDDVRLGEVAVEALLLGLAWWLLLGLVVAQVGTLSVANRQRVEIAKALSQNARVLIMDEPTAALADADVRRLMAVVGRLRARGVGIIYVSHKLPEIFELADRVTVLRDGALIGTRPIGEVTEQTLVAMMVGREIDHLFPKSEPSIGETILKVAQRIITEQRNAL